MSQPAKHTLASQQHFYSYLSARPITSAISLDGVVVKPAAAGNMETLEYFTHKDQGGIINRSPPTS